VGGEGSAGEVAEEEGNWREGGRRALKSPTLRVLFRLAKAMGITPSALVKGIERELSRPEPATPGKNQRVPRKGGTR